MNSASVSSETERKVPDNPFLHHRSHQKRHDVLVVPRLDPVAAPIDPPTLFSVMNDNANLRLRPGLTLDHLAENPGKTSLNIGSHDPDGAIPEDPAPLLKRLAGKDLITERRGTKIDFRQDPSPVGSGGFKSGCGVGLGRIQNRFPPGGRPSSPILPRIQDIRMIFRGRFFKIREASGPDTKEPGGFLRLAPQDYVHDQTRFGRNSKMGSAG